MANKEKQLKAFFIFVTKDKNTEAALTKLADDSKAHDLALATLDPGDEAVESYKVNLAPEVKNTIMVYRNKRVVAKHVNLLSDAKGLAELSKSLDLVLNPS